MKFFLKAMIGGDERLKIIFEETEKLDKVKIEKEKIIKDAKYSK